MLPTAQMLFTPLEDELLALGIRRWAGGLPGASCTYYWASCCCSDLNLSCLPCIGTHATARPPPQAWL